MKTNLHFLVHIGGRRQVDAHEVAYFEANSNYTVVHLQTKQKLIVATTLGIIENRLSAYGFFVRANRGFLVNTSYVKAFDIDNIFLQNALKIGIPRRKKQQVFDALSELIE
jgi:two-component system, LytTR family, response regulator